MKFYHSLINQKIVLVEGGEALDNESQIEYNNSMESEA